MRRCEEHAAARGRHQPRRQSAGPRLRPNGTLYAAAAGRGGTQCPAEDEPASGSPARSGSSSNGVVSVVADRCPRRPARTARSRPATTPCPSRPTAPCSASRPRPARAARLRVCPPGSGSLGDLLRIGPGPVNKQADIDDYEWSHNPDGAQLDSDPYGVSAVTATHQVADAAGNDLLTSSTASHDPRRVAQEPAGGESVPTSVTRGPDGAIYVGELGGEGTPAGGSRVWRIVPGQKPTVFRTGFSAITGIGFGPATPVCDPADTDDPVNLTPEGDVVRVGRAATQDAGLGALHFPAGLAIGPRAVCTSRTGASCRATPAGGPFGGARPGRSPALAGEQNLLSRAHDARLSSSSRG